MQGLHSPKAFRQIPIEVLENHVQPEVDPDEDDDFEDERSITLANLNAGDSIRLQFFAASDTNTKGQTPNWEIDKVQLDQGAARAVADAKRGVARRDGQPAEW